MRLRPLPRAVLALAAGILAAVRLPFPDISLPLLLGAIMALVFVPSPWRPRILLACCFTLGMVLSQRASGAARDDCRAVIPDNTMVEATAIVAVLPLADGAGAFHLKELRRGRAARESCGGEVRVRLRAGAMGTTGAAKSSPQGEGGARSARSDAPAVGATVKAWGRWLANPPDPIWPRPPERSGTLLVDSLQVVAPATAVRHPLLQLRASMQARLRLLFPERSALAEAMLLARKEGIATDQRDRFARAGLAHLLAISGLHVGLIAGVLLLLGGILRLSPRVTAGCTIGLTIAYVLFLGAPHAAARAALQITLALLGRIWQRPADPYSLIATAAAIILLFDPLAVLDAGFQLSFAGTGGIIALRRRFLTAFPGSIPRPIRESIAVSLAATLATAPITVIHFGQIAPIGVVANLIAIPVTGVAVPAIVASLGLSFLSTSIATFLAGGAELLLMILDWIATGAALVPGGQLLIPRDSIFGWGAAALLATLLAGRIAGERREVRASVQRFAIAGTVIAVMIAWPVAVQLLHDGRLEIHAIDVGQGDALAIRTPAGRWILVDAGLGGTGHFDAGRSRVVPFLLRHGARRIDMLVLTHPDADHIGGAGAVLDAFDIGIVVDPGVAVGKSIYRELLRQANNGRLRWIAARAGRELRIDDVVIQILQPDHLMLDESPTENDLSVAFRLEYGRFGALFLGDAPAAVEEELVERYGEALRADLLKVAHHGSTTSTAEALLDTAEPRIAVISVGRRNRYGHPAPQVLERLTRREIDVWRTDLAGNITFRVSRTGEIEIVTQR